MSKDNLPSKLFVWDTETSGVRVDQDRILTCYAAIYDQDMNVLDERSWTIDPGVEIPQGASDVHGMTTEWVRENGRKDWKAAIKEIHNTLNGAAQSGIPIVAFNLPYDFTILHHEARRAGFAPGAGPILENGHFYDPLVHEKARDKYVKGKGQRKLGNMCARNGIEFKEEDAHAAEYDVLKTAELAWKFLKREKNSVTDLQALLPSWHEEQAQGLEDYFKRDGQKNDKGEAIQISRGWPLTTQIGN